MRKTCLDMVYELAKQDERVFFIGSDLGAGTLKQFKAEMPGIMAWAVRGMLEWYDTGLAEPDGVIQATASYRSESDVVGAFMAECREPGIDFKEASGDLYAGYSYWSEREGEQSISHQMFGRKLAVRDGLTLNRDGGKRRYWVGLRLLSEAIPPGEWKPKR